MSDTIWKDIPDYEGFYEVSNKGEVRSKKRVITYVRNGDLIKKRIGQKVLRPCNWGRSKEPYLFVGLKRNGKSKNFKIHRLVLLAFVSSRPDKMVIDHIDGDKRNNKLENLEYVTSRENTHRYYKRKKGCSLGVSFKKSHQRFTAEIYYKGSYINLGSFKKENDAIIAFKSAHKTIEKIDNILKEQGYAT